MRGAAGKPSAAVPSTPVIRVDDVYFPLKSLSEYAGLSVRTLRGYLTHPAHPLPCYRIVGKVVVRRSDFDEWALRFRSAPTSAVDALVTDALRGL
jgi:hypothetical protein